MLARLRKTLAMHLAVASVVALALGAGGTTAVLLTGQEGATVAPVTDADHEDADDDSQDDAPDADEQEPAETPDAEDSGARPTDTHGYCVSQVAQAPLPEGSTVTHGSLVSAAAHACGKSGAPAAGASKGAAKSAEKRAAAATRAAQGKAHAHHTTGKPTG